MKLKERSLAGKKVKDDILGVFRAHDRRNWIINREKNMRIGEPEIKTVEIDLRRLQRREFGVEWWENLCANLEIIN